MASGSPSLGKIPPTPSSCTPLLGHKAVGHLQR